MGDLLAQYNFGECPQCHRHTFLNTHICDPIYECIFADDGGKEITEVRASSLTNAAGEFVSQYDYDTNGLSESRRVKVREQGADEWTVFEVTGEVVRSYSARELKKSEVENANRID